MPTKDPLRARVLKKCEALSASKRLTKSKKIFRALLRDPWFRRAEHIAIYHGTASEVATRVLLAKILRTKKVFLPRVCPIRKNITLRRVRFLTQDLVSGAYGIMEPKVSCPKRSADRMDLIVVPGLAFDRKGGRLGRGGGYYDRLLKRAGKAPTIGICFKEQLVEKVPMKAHDVRVDKIITD